MAHAELTQAAAGEAISPRPRSLAAWLEASLAMLVEIPAALLVTAEIVILFAGVVARYGLHRPLIWSDELAAILFLCLVAGGGDGGSPPPSTYWGSRWGLSRARPRCRAA